MFPKKLCSFGILDININLVLRQIQAETYNFNINKYNSVEDLENLFFPNESDNKNNNSTYYRNENLNNKGINYFDFISLSSDNNLINTLLFINRAYKTKTFIEFIMLNQMEFSETTKFVRKMIQEIFDRNYFFIIEHKILDLPSKIKFIIKILNNDNDDIISMKTFELFEINEIEVDQNVVNEKGDTGSMESRGEESDPELFFANLNQKNNYYNYKSVLSIDKINYNFGDSDYFLFDLSITQDLKISNKKEFPIIIYEIIKKYPKIKIILILDDNLNSIEKSNLKLNKKLIELSDIIFAFKDSLNNFLEIYNSTIKKSLKSQRNNTNTINSLNNSKENLEFIGNPKKQKFDLIMDDQDKCRKNIPRLSVILDNLNNVTIYEQEGIQMKIDYVEVFNLSTLNIKNKNKIEYLYNNSNLFAHIFIAGFLSRKINEKSLRVCIKAGDLLMKKSLFIFMNNIDYISDIDFFNVLVPSNKKYNGRKINKEMIKEFEQLFIKENNFILDCTNVIKCQKKEYNPLFDENCASFLLRDINMKHLKDAGFINKKGIILKDPANVRKKPNNNIKNIINNKAMYAEPNFFLRNNKFPFSKTSYNTISSNYESIDNKKSPKFKSIFNPIMENQIKSKIITLSPKSKNLKKKLYLPKMVKTYYNFNYNYQDKESKTLTSNKADLKKYNSMISRNIFNMGNKKRFFSVNNYKSKINNNDIKNYPLSKFLSHPNTNNTNIFPKIYKKGFSQK
jgi:hypothetical protein